MERNSWSSASVLRSLTFYSSLALAPADIEHHVPSGVAYTIRTSAPGCNRTAVAEFFLRALAALSHVPSRIGEVILGSHMDAEKARLNIVLLVAGSESANRVRVRPSITEQSIWATKLG